tara:strand:+ start:96 stop:467 length:372 start_codon:yes stop_codon:yes gene_type:complete
MAYIDKKITYDFDKDVPKALVAEKPKKTVDEMLEMEDYLNTLDPNWWEERPPPPLEPDDTKTKKEGLESLYASSIPSATTKESFNAYYSILSRYYTPSELIGKSLFELDKMLQLHIKADGSLF